MTEELHDRWGDLASIAFREQRPILLWESDVCVVYLDNKWGLAIPYPPEDLTDKEKNHGYRSLKGKLGDLREVPEIHG